MAPASNEEQFKFLISCIRYSNNGKVDFGQVAKECKIVSKGAAAKRYERMMRSHGIAPNAASIKPAPGRSIKTERGESSSSLSTSKKRKAEAFLDENTADDDEGFGSIKTEPNGMREQSMVKQEGEHVPGALSLGEAANLMQYYDPPSSYGSVQLGSNFDYNGGDYGGRSRFAAPMGQSFTIQAPQSYDYTSPYAAGIGGIPRSEGPNLHYQSVIQYQGDEQGHADSPLVVE